MSETLPRRPLLARLAAPFQGGAAGGALLILSAVAAMALANSPAWHAYHAALTMPVGVSAGASSYVVPVESWINDGLMAVFFLLVGLEIRREATHGQLASLRRAAAPALAALGGMVVPALLFAACALADPSALRGWAIPTATDIAFSLAVLRVLGARAPAGLRVFLTALAIIDDLGAILIIAVFFTTDLNLVALAAGGVLWLGLLGCNLGGVRRLWPYVAGFLLMWVCLARSGIHPTLAGVAVAFVVPQRDGEDGSPAHRLEHTLEALVSLLVLPLFGLANAGLRLAELSLGVLADPVVPGIVLGLLVGKPLGVFGATWLAAKLRLAHLPAQLTWRLVLGAAVLCGIGFTMSLFIGHLAFPGGERQEEVKAAVFFASVVAAGLGLATLSWALRRKS